MESEERNTSNLITSKLNDLNNNPPDEDLNIRNTFESTLPLSTPRTNQMCTNLKLSIFESIIGCQDVSRRELSDVEIQRRLKNLVNLISNQEPNCSRLGDRHNLPEGKLCLLNDKSNLSNQLDTCVLESIESFNDSKRSQVALPPTDEMILDAIERQCTNSTQNSKKSNSSLMKAETDESFDQTSQNFAACNEQFFNVHPKVFENTMQTFLRPIDHKTMSKRDEFQSSDQCHKNEILNSSNDTLVSNNCKVPLMNSVENTEKANTRSKLNELRITQNRMQSSRVPPLRLLNGSGDLYTIESGQNVVYNSRSATDHRLGCAADDKKSDQLLSQDQNEQNQLPILISEQSSIRNRSRLGMKLESCASETMSHEWYERQRMPASECSSLGKASAYEMDTGHKLNCASCTRIEISEPVILTESLNNSKQAIQVSTNETRITSSSSETSDRKNSAKSSKSSCNSTFVLNTAHCNLCSNAKSFFAHSHTTTRSPVCRLNKGSECLPVNSLIIDKQTNCNSSNSSTDCESNFSSIFASDCSSNSPPNSVSSRASSFTSSLSVQVGNSTMLPTVSVKRSDSAKDESIVRSDDVCPSNNQLANSRPDQVVHKKSVASHPTDKQISQSDTKHSNNNQAGRSISPSTSNKSSEDELISKSKQLYINTSLSSVTNTNGLPQSTNGLINQPQQSPTATSSTASSLSLPVDLDSIDEGIHLNSELNSVPEPKQSSRDYRTHEEFVYAMKEDLAEWLNTIYDLQLNVHNFMDQVGTGVIICRHANNLIQKAKKFYNRPDNNSQHANLSINSNPNEQRRFSQCSVASSVSSNESNNELNSLPVTLNHYDTIDHLDETTDTMLENSFTNGVQQTDEISTQKLLNNSTNLKSIKSPLSSPKHKILNLTNGQLSKANSAASLLISPIRTPNGKQSANQQTPLIKKSTKQVQSNGEQMRTHSVSRIPQFNNSASNKQVTSTVKKSTNARSKQTQASKLPASPNRRRSLATSASSSLISNSINNSIQNSNKSSITRPLIRTPTNLNTSLGPNKRTGLTSNKSLSQSSSSIYSQLMNCSQLERLRQTNESHKLTPTTARQQRTKNSKSNVPLSRTQSNHQLINQSNDQLDSTKRTKTNDSIGSNQQTATTTTIQTTNGYVHLWTDRQQRLKNLATADLVVYRDNVKSMKGMNEWHSRDNVSNFIKACRNLFKIRDCLLFETDDLVMRKNERSFVLCMLEVARIGCVFGIASPLIIQLEQEIDRELALEERQSGQSGTDCSGDYQTATGTNSLQAKDTDSLLDSSDYELEEHSNEPPTQIVTNDLKSLHERVVELLSFCKCPSQFPMVKVADGKYRIGESKVLIFVRILRNHVMVRVGGGWDCLSHYLLRHDPCRQCRSGHKYASQAKVTISSSNLNNSFISRKLSCDSINSLPYSNNNQSPNRTTFSKSNLIMNKDENLSIMITYNR